MQARDNSGALFKNDKRETENHPLYKGDAIIGGKKYWISSWLKKTKAGYTYMSLAFRLADEPAKPKPASRSSFDKEIDDMIPFAPETRG